MKDPTFDDDQCKNVRDNDLRTCTCNVRSLNWEGATDQLVDVLVSVKLDGTRTEASRSL